MDRSGEQEGERGSFSGSGAPRRRAGLAGAWAALSSPGRAVASSYHAAWRSAGMQIAGFNGRPARAGAWTAAAWGRGSVAGQGT